jgi:ABC-type nitrate/sulfonate/bicarbonate transport system substrate-binding protein
MNYRKLISFTLLALSMLVMSTCTHNAGPKKFEVTIDWIPSPEYYGFFYAKHFHLYEQAGLDVTIRNGTGAPTVATQIALGNIYAGTTTSDNILRVLARGGELSRAVPLLAYNPSVIAVLPNSSIHKLADLQGKKVGVNKQSSPYQQLMWLIRKGKVGDGHFTEIPIGYGGAVQLESRDVDAILAYTSNTVVNVEKDGIKPVEIHFGDDENGVKLYGTVLALGSKADLAKAGLRDEDVASFVRVTLQGYQVGATDIDGAVNSLLEGQPTLDRHFLEIAIRKIAVLRQGPPYALQDLDAWVEGEGIDTQSRERARSLYH